VLPVSSSHEVHVASIVEQLRSAGVRVDSVSADDGLGRRIRAAKLDKIPYVLVVGDDDIAANTVGVNPRGGDVERDVPLDTFIDRLRLEVAEDTRRAFDA